MRRELPGGEPRAVTVRLRNVGASGRPGDPADTIESGRPSLGSRLAGPLGRIFPHRAVARLTALAPAIRSWLAGRPGPQHPACPDLAGTRRARWLTVGVFTRGTWLRIGLAVVVLAGAAGFLVVRSMAPSAAQRSLADIRVVDYRKTGEFSNTSGGGTNSAAAFIGPPVGSRRISAIVTGPGVKVILVPATPTPGEVPRTGSIGFGLAPHGCYLDVDYFFRTAMPYPWFGVTAAQLRQVRSGQRSILLVWAVCGRDAARPAQ